MPTDSIQLQTSATAVKLFYFSAVTGLAWNPTLASGAGAFEAWDDSHYSQYGVAAAQAGTTRLWLAARPAGVSIPCIVVARRVVDGTLANDLVIATAQDVDTTATIGLGAYLRTVTVTSSGSPVVGATVRLTASSSFVATTDVSGVATFALDAGTYTLTVAKAGYSHTPATVVITGAGNTAVSLTAQSIAAPVLPAQTTAYLTTRDGQGAPLAAVTVYFRLLNPSGTADAWRRLDFSAVSDGTGLLQVALTKSSLYEASLGSGRWVRFTTGSASTYALPEILGGYDP